MWSAFKNLCNMGENIDPSLIFHLSDKLSITTPTYAVILDDTIQSNPMKDNKPECDKVSIRENLNPEKSYDMLSQGVLSSTGCENTNQDAAFQLDLECQLNIQRSYISYCSKSFANDITADDLKYMGNYFTPDGIIPSQFVPKAPKPIFQGEKKVARDLHISGLEGTSPTNVGFGFLSLLPQSPMFACIPVFSKLNNSTVHDTVLSSSVRFGPNQCLPIRQTNTHQDGNMEGFQTSQRIHNLSSSHMNVSLIGNRRTNMSESETNTNLSVNAKSYNHSLDKGSVISRIVNTPTTTGALRHLVSAATFNLGFLTLESTRNSTNNSLIYSPNTRLDPPILRSAVHRTTIPSTPNIGCGQVSPLVSRSNVQLFNPASRNPSVLSSSSTPRPLFNHQVPNSFSHDVHNSGPRTRSQVAAAAAVARASGIQRRSNRLLRSRGHTRKLDSKQSTPGYFENSVTSHSKSCDSPVSNISTEDLHKSVIEDSASFGVTGYHKAPVSTDYLSSKGDPRVHSLNQYLELLVQLGKAYQLLVRHHWRSATRLLSKLPASQLPTGRILAWAARAHMDNADYQTAHKLFSEAHRREPWQLCGMDFYSTVLWQLQADQELSQLAHDLLELDRNAPEPWCTVGNCFSLQGEHEVAIKFFRRALQVSPINAYAWTLLGHEQSTLEEYDRALAAFQYALQLDPRHYNALFGMSNVYYKQEKFNLAETYLNRAVAIFPNSHLLLTNLAALRSRLGRIDDGIGSAIDLVNRACKIQPNNPLARYHRASILFHLGQYSDVLSELQKLLVLTPREAMVYLMIGHTYKKLGNTPQAMIHYSWAMELDPKGANTHLRDIMANPAISTRNSSRPVSTTTAQAGIESRLNSFPNSIRTNFDDDSDVGERILAVDEDMTNGLAHPAQSTNRQNVIRTGVRRLTDFSLLYETESPEELRIFDNSEEHYDTMDSSGADGRNEQTLPDE